MSKPTYLIHYASPYYDPIKAHEYYMDHRKLKGRNPSQKVVITDTRPHQGPAPRVSEYYKNKGNKKEEVKETKPKQSTSYTQTVNLINKTTETSKSKRGTLNEKGQAAKKELRERINSERDSRLNAEEASKNAQLDSAKVNKDQTISSNKTSLEQAKASRQSEMKEYTQLTKTKIKAISDKFNNGDLSSEDRKSLLKELISLKESNDKKRAELDNAFISKSIQISSNIENAKTNYSNETASIRVNSANNKNTIREESKNKYNQELEKIYSNSAYLKPIKKSKKK